MKDYSGQSFGRYRITEQIGEGGMATVYKAYDTRLECDVAVKVIRTEQLAPAVLERALKRFEREAKAVARLTHPAIVRVTDYGEFEGSPYLVMEYLPGGTLKEYLKSHDKLNYKESVRLLLPIVQALDYAHEQNLIHRDVKPSNILLTSKMQPMLTDFGVAKVIDEEVTQDLTGTSATVGTPEYMAPEQVVSKTVDQRADIYALAVVLFEMVTGRRPFEADTPMAVLFKHAGEPLPKPSTYSPDLPEEVERILFKALAKKPEDRYQSMGELSEALVNYIEESYFKPVEIENTPKTTSLETNDIEFSEPDDSLYYETLVDSPVSQIQQNILPNTSDKYEINLGYGVKMEFIRIPAGRFLMGSDPQLDPFASKDEFPQHEVYLDEYWIGTTLVTNEQYLAYVEAMNISSQRITRFSRTDRSKGLHPVTNVNYMEAQRFCAWLEKISGNKVRLPSEAQWEKAARGTDGRKYPWGNQDPNKKLSQFDLIFGDTAAVFAHPDGASPYGALDMAGNVWEWVADWYGDYPSGMVSNPMGPASGEYRVLRGGSWSSNENYIRSAYRDWNYPSGSYSDDGFRCAISACVSP